MSGQASIKTRIVAMLIVDSGLAVSEQHGETDMKVLFDAMYKIAHA